MTLLPVSITGLCLTQGWRGHRAWRFISGAMSAGAVWATAWLTGAFFQPLWFGFVPFAGLALQLAASAAFFAMASAPGRPRRVLLGIAVVVGCWAAVAFGGLLFTRIID